MSAPGKLQRIFLYHIWACVPFALVWLAVPRTVGVSHDPGEARGLQFVLGFALAYLALRSWLVFRGKRPEQWRYVWPLADVALVTAALCEKRVPTDSWLMLLYLFPVVEAAAALKLRWALLVAALAMAGYLASSGVHGVHALRYAYASFRLFFLVLMASLLTCLGRELARAHKELALADYRNRLAAEMHDGIQQYLAAIASRLDLAHSMAESDPRKAVDLAVGQRDLTRQAADELRVMVRRLRSSSPSAEGIAAAIRQYAALFEDRSNLPVTLRVSGDEAPLDPHAEHALFRIVQEALNNVAKHARANAVGIELEFGPDTVRCAVTDDGVGFEPGDLPREPGDLGGFGMQTMSQRAAEVGGTLEVQSRPGAGATVAVTMGRSGSA